MLRFFHSSATMHSDKSKMLIQKNVDSPFLSSSRTRHFLASLKEVRMLIVPWSAVNIFRLLLCSQQLEGLISFLLGK